MGSLGGLGGSGGDFRWAEEMRIKTAARRRGRKSRREIMEGIGASLAHDDCLLTACKYVKTILAGFKVAIE